MSTQRKASKFHGPLLNKTNQKNYAVPMTSLSRCGHRWVQLTPVLFNPSENFPRIKSLAFIWSVSNCAKSLVTEGLVQGFLISVL